ncbi:MAG: hypothetical protein KAJ46_05360 [Sedimentisphaerales bacterium]|nr:hypothetical protein [Sedimentisphaerales bacterium]
MSEIYPGDNSLLNLADEAETGVEYIETGKAPYYLEFRKLLYRLLLATKRANDLRVFDEGGLDVGVKAGKFWFGSTLREYTASSGNTLADNKANIYIYINSAGTLILTEYTAWPSAGTFHIRLAQVTTSGGDITAIVDMRGSELFTQPITGGNCADYGSSGSVSVIFKATLTAGSTVQVHNTDAPYKYRILDAWSVARSADAGTWKLTDGTNDITDAVAVTAADKTIDRAGTIDDAYHEIAASGSLSVVGDGSLADVEVYVIAIRVS